ncbi:MAG TPA: TolC family protein, partial [Longimicrobiaceae bacterium]|nr:TolC family protein [Longimicrobiaceae bacterium]
MNALPLALALLATPPAARDTLHLPELQQAALRTDPRARQLALQRQASELRLRNLAAERLPALTGRAQATHQSEVASIPIALPGGQTPPTPPKDQYEAHVEVEQLIYDGGVLGRRRGAERAQLTVEEARIAADLYPLRDEVNETFFTAFLLQERLAEATTLIDDLDARLATLRAQVRNGAALPGDTAVVRAEQLKAMEDRAEIAAGRHAALARLALLTSVDVTERDVLALPRLGDVVARTRALAVPADEAPVPGARPEYAV